MSISRQRGFPPQEESGGGGAVSDGTYGDVTVTADGATWTINGQAVTFAKMAQLAGLSVSGRAANTTGVQAAITAGNDDEVLRRSGTSIGFGTIVAGGIANGAVTLAKMANLAATKVIGSIAGGAPAALGISDLLDWISTTRGAVAIRGAAAWSAVVPVTAGYVFTDNGLGADPTWTTPAGFDRAIITTTDWTESSGTRATVTPASGPALSFTPVANGRYLLMVLLPFTTAAVTTGMQYCFTDGTTTGTVKSQFIFGIASATASVLRNGAFGALVAASGSSAVGDNMAIGWGFYNAGAAPSGNVTVDVATEVAASGVTIKAGAILLIKKVN